MKNLDVRPWYKKKRYVIPLGLLSTVGFLGSSNSPQVVTVPAPIVVPAHVDVKPVPVVDTSVQAAPVVKEKVKINTTETDTGLSNNNYYTNTNGNEVHSPAYSETVPSGASAECRDGTYSFSQSRRGTCSHHGGVMRWY